MKKIDQLRIYIDAHDWHRALKMAASFPRLGKDREAITKAWAAKSNQSFYLQMGHDVDLLVAAGVSAIKDKYQVKR
ncbi:MAG: hypothetical protein KAR07_02425 [Spirochaetes bacterium]|nr:hypothetical protein [Spirochaetota bacterium]